MTVAGAGVFMRRYLDGVAGLGAEGAGYSTVRGWQDGHAVGLVHQLRGAEHGQAGVALAGLPLTTPAQQTGAGPVHLPDRAQLAHHRRDLLLLLGASSPAPACQKRPESLLDRLLRRLGSVARAAVRQQLSSLPERRLSHASVAMFGRSLPSPRRT
ncbi:hypothetical protein BJ996_007206 [Streptomyces phaeogriseichromatogenes]|nr:hypothetical protein [Streptomyces murinus]BBC91290.1 hypothetical protein SRO_0114 [Streptomyces rochei]